MPRHTEPLTDLFTGQHTTTLDHLHALVTEQADAIATEFYDQLLSDPNAQAFLDEDLIGGRLRHVWAQWLRELFAPRHRAEVESFIERQRTIGQVHARLDVPLSLVGESMRIVRAQLASLLVHSEQDPAVHTDGLLAISTVLDHANSLMTAAYVDASVNDERHAGAIRQDVDGPTLALMFERMRAELYQWFAGCLAAASNGPATSLADSDVGLWIRHRLTWTPAQAARKQLEEAVERIDALAGRPGSPQAASPLDPEFELAVEELAWQLADLRERSLNDETGRDPLTRLLNRRALPSVLKRETRLAIRFSRPFVLLMIDLDRFKSINDEHGHAVGDDLLRETARLLSDQARPADLVFRLGGEEFLVLVPESDAVAGQQLAERLRGEIARHTFRPAHGPELRVTASLGAAVHDGHPDFERTMRAADRALYRAKERGRNQVVWAYTSDDEPSSPPTGQQREQLEIA